MGIENTVHGYRFADEPLAGESAQFPLSRGATPLSSHRSASPAGLRPWGLRRMTRPVTSCVPAPVAAEYDHERQLRLDGEGQPVIEMGPPTAPTTGSTDGSDGDPSEDYVND